MKFTIEKSIFTQTLKSSVGILDAIITNPIMDCVLLEVTNNELIITSSNNSASLKNTIKSGVKVEKEGKALVKGRIIYNIVSKLKEKELTLEIIDSSILRINTTTFSSDINVLDFFSYPNINFDYADWTKVNVSRSFFTKIFNKIIPCINPNEQNPVLNGVLLDASRQNGIIEAVGTDSYHLAYVKDNYQGEKFKIIINTETIKQINDILNGNNDLIFLYLKNSQAIVEVKNSIMLCRLIEGTFPSAIKTIEAINPCYFNINKSDLINAVDRGLILASGEKKPSVLLNINQNKIRITCRSIEYGSSYEEINTTTNLQEPISISLNAKLLFDLIKNVEHQDVRFEFTSATKPIIIKDQTDPNYTSLILPIRNI